MTTTVWFNGIVLKTDLEGPGVAEYLLSIAELIYYESQEAVEEHLEELITYGRTTFD